MEEITLWKNDISSITDEYLKMDIEWRVLRTKPLRVKWNWIKFRWMYTITLYKQ